MKRSVENGGGNGLRAELVFSAMLKEIRAGIAAGALAPGDRLPSETVLAVKYGMSVNSVRRGMDELVRQGVVSRRRGSGTYILEPARNGNGVGARADTVLFACSVQHMPTHPFFGKRDQALRARLSELGWKSEHFAPQAPPDQVGHTIWHELDIRELGRRLESDKRIAGLVVDRVTSGPVAESLGVKLPCVSLSADERFPYADYCWSDELARALTLLARAGARRIHVFSGHTDAELRHAITAAGALASAEGSDMQAAYSRVLLGTFTQTMHETYLLARRLLKAGAGVVPDGLVMGSDIHAQGVLDALAELPRGLVERLRLAAFTNRGSPVRSRIPFTAFEADGEAAGRAAAELLDALIVSPGSAPARVHLACTVYVAGRAGAR